MSPKKRFLLRLDERLWSVLERWAADELRSVNGQIEFLLRDAAREAHRLGGPDDGALESVGSEEAPDGAE